MSVRRILTPLVWLAVLGGAGFAAYATHERWMPYVFPVPKAADEQPAHDEHDHDHPPQVKLTPQAVANLKLVVGPITPQAYWRTTLIPGVVIDRPGENDRGVTARITGVVTEIKATPGEMVRAGAELFRLQPVGEVLLNSQAELAKAAKELSLVTANRDRIAQQVSDGVSQRSSLIEPEIQVKRAANQVQGLRRQLQAFGLAATQLDQVEKGEYVTEVVVTAPPAASMSAASTEKPRPTEYEVQDLKVMLGETVQAGQTLGTLSDHSRLYIEGRAFESEVGSIRKLAEAGLPVRGEFTDDIPGEWPDLPPLIVRNLSNVVDHGTHTFAFYLTLDNQSRRYERDAKTHRVWRFRPGQHVRLRVPLEKLGDDVLVLPAGAVVREGAEAYAFVKKGEAFVRTPVRVLYEDRTEVVLANDGSLGRKAQVVRNQAAALNRAVKAAEGGGDHGHDHEH
jgi:multidrug efflux pump subunit AcrA (membrane-fusion protein)